MFRTPRLALVGLLGLAALSACLLGAGQPASTNEQYSVDSGQTSSSPPTGAPAIPVPPSGTITCQDVLNYVSSSSHHVWRQVSEQDRKSVNKPVNIEFVSDTVVTSRLSGESTGLPKTEVLIFVTFTGGFSFSGPEGTTAHYPVGFEVFWARNGYLLLAGGLQATPVPPPSTLCPPTPSPSPSPSPSPNASPSASPTP